MIENNGKEKTEKWLKGFVRNFSKSPSGNDRAQILSVASGESKLAIANTYYYALMASGKKEKNSKMPQKKLNLFSQIKKIEEHI